MVAPLTLPTGFTENSVRVHPVVLYTICDAYVRRNQGQKRVIGTLLGNITDGVVEVKSCYAVPHSENNDQVAFDVQHHQTMMGLHQKVYSQEQVVGWFSTSAEVTGSDALIQSFFSNEASNPILLTVDAALSNGKLDISAYVSRTLSVKGRLLAREFQAVDCSIVAADVEALGSELMSAEEAPIAPSGESEVVGALESLRAALAAAAAYVDAVVEGRAAPNVAVGRALARAVAAVPQLAPAEFQAALAHSQNDVLITSYFGNLIRTHVALADKLGTLELPLL